MIYDWSLVIVYFVSSPVSRKLLIVVL